MKTLLSLIALFPASLFADGFDEPVNDRAIKANFEKQLGALRDAEKVPDCADLAKQLKEQKHFPHELPPVVTPAELDTASVYDACKDGVLCFGNIYKCDKCSNWHGNIAGGFVISEDGLAVTNYHVMENDKAGAFGAMTIDGKLFPVKEIVASSKADDLAIVRLEGEDFKPLTIAEGDSVGADVTVISHPQGRFYTVSEGIIARYFKAPTKKRGEVASRMAITADYAKGSSGSPVFNDDGAVIGVVASTNSIYYSKKDGVDQNLQMVIKSCIPSGSILKLLKEAKE